MVLRARSGGGRRLLPAVVLALLGVGALLSACGSSRPSSAGRSASGAPAGGASSAATPAAAIPASVAGGASTTLQPSEAAFPSAATSTSLPSPSYVPGTRPGGSLAELGPVERLVLQPLLPGRVPSEPSTTSGEAVPGGIDVAFREFGSGPDLVLLPGEHTSMSSWGAQLLAALGASYTVVTPDLPGSGYSGAARGVRDVEQEADLVAALSVALGLDHPTVLGWGLGGQVALALAERHPGMAGRLVLADTSAGGRGSTRPDPAAAALLASPTSTDVELSTVLFPATAIGAQQQWLQRVDRLPTDDLTAASVIQQAALEAAAATGPSLARGLGRVAVPVLVVVGSLDELFPPADADALVRALRRARELVLPGAGYASILQDEPEFLVALDKFTGVAGG